MPTDATNPPPASPVAGGFGELAGRRVVIWGAGREGRAVADHLTGLGIEFALLEPAELSHDELLAALTGCEVAIKAPGIASTDPLYAAAVEAGVRVTSLTDLWMHENAQRTVAITGTKGKSTTSSLLAHMLTAGGIDASLRGNIGTPVLLEPDPSAPSAVVVMELSSYQAQSLTVSPRALAVTSLFPEHLTWHGGEAAYYRDKLNAAAHGPELLFALGHETKVLEHLAAAAPGHEVLTTGPHTVDVDAAGDLRWADGTRLAGSQIPLIGVHQVRNAALAALIAGTFGLSPAVIAEAITGYSPLEHRMQKVPSTDGRTWIDDSLATAPEAVIATLSALPAEPIAVLIGGSDRGLDFAPLIDWLADHPHVTPLLLGPVGDRISGALSGALRAGDFASTVAWAHSPANPARTVLLCPGAPSFDEFASYEERSAAFQRAAVQADQPSGV